MAVRELGEQIRDELLLLPSVSQADLTNVRKYQIDVRFPKQRCGNTV